MTMLSNPSGWSKRRQKARKRHPSKNSPERLDVRAARAAFYAGGSIPAPVVEQAPAAPVAPLQDAYANAKSSFAAFSLAGNWMQVRSAVKGTLGLDRVPANKAEAAELLTEAGFMVEGYDGGA